MSTNNPFRKHANSLFASRGCDIDEALSYAQDIISGMPTGGAEALTAMMVIINTAANAFDQAQGPSPEKLAVQDMVRSMVSRQLDDWVACNLESAIEGWMDNNLSDQLDNVLDDKVRDWMNDNLEGMMEGEALCEAIRDAFRNNLTLSIC
jgi:hypothetical protein